MKTIILVGGLGTRLRKVIGEIPKPLAPVGDRPFLDYVVSFISAQGFKDFIIASGYRSDMIQNCMGDGVKRGLKIAYTVEKELLGTGGAIKLAEPFIDSEDVFVTNGDTYFEVDLNAMRRFHTARGAVATMALAFREDTRRYGKVNFDEDSHIVSFEEKADNGRAGYINGGIYIFRKEVFDLIPAHRVCSLEKEILPALIGKGLYGFTADNYFIDIGIPEDYDRATRELPLRRSS